MKRKNLLGITPLLMAADASFSQYENAHRRTYSDPPYNKGEDTKNKIIRKKIIFTNDKGQMQTKRIKMTLKEFREIQSECNKTSKTIEEFLIEKEKEKK